MPLSADGILGFFDGITRRCEAFEHVSLTSVAATTGNVPLTAAPFGGGTGDAAAQQVPVRVCGTLVKESENSSSAGNSTFSGGSRANARAIPTAAVLPATPSTRPTRNPNTGTLPLPSAVATSATLAQEANGTLYICALPETLWRTIAAVTATSAPSQRQLAFTTEAPAFSTSAEPSLVLDNMSIAQATRHHRGSAAGGSGAGGNNNNKTKSSSRINGGNSNAAGLTSEASERSAFVDPDNFSTGDDASDTPPPPQTRTTRRNHHNGSSSGPAGAWLGVEDPRHFPSSKEHLVSSGLPSPVHPKARAPAPTSDGVESIVGGNAGCDSVDENGIVLPEGSSTARKSRHTYTAEPTEGTSEASVADPAAALCATERPGATASSLPLPFEPQRTSSISGHILERNETSTFLAGSPVLSGAGPDSFDARWNANERAAVLNAEGNPCAPFAASCAADTETLLSGTVGVLLWVANDASAAAKLDSTDFGNTPDALGAPFLGGAERRDARVGPGNTAGGPAFLRAPHPTPADRLPACLCIGVQDVAAAESSDTQVLTSRERHVQRFTVLLCSGAPVYRAKSTSDIFERAVLGSGSDAVDNAAAKGSVATASPPSFYTAAPQPISAAVSFIFYQGGISRCVASLKRHAPTIAYTHRRGVSARTVEGNNINSNGAASNVPLLPASTRDGVGKAAADRTKPSFSTSQAASSPTNVCDSSAASMGGDQGSGAGRSYGSAFYSTAAAPMVKKLAEETGFVEGDHLQSNTINTSSSAATGAARESQHGGKALDNVSDGGGGWRHRLTNVVFGHNNGGSGGKGNGAVSVSPIAEPSPRARDGNQFVIGSPLRTAAAPTVTAAGIGFARNTASSANGKDEKKAQACHTRSNNNSRVSPTSGASSAKGEHSSNSSFEDLTDEMTAVRLGACYVPPKPLLPPADTPGRLVTAAEWAKVFDILPTYSTDTREAASRPGRAMNPERWRAFRQSVYERGGLLDSSIRFEVWCYLLGAYPVGSTAAEQQAIMEQEKRLYERLTSQWKSFLPEQEEHFAVYRYAKHSILKDVERTDRTHPSFRDDDSDMLRVLRELLLAHVMYNMDLGYSQGMSDVAAIASLVAPPSNEPAMFLCFRKMLSEHMSNNFVIEERKKDAPYASVKGLQRKLYQVQVLTRHFHPRLYGHLKMRCMAEDMTFCFRWLLVCFKRDLGSLADTMRCWDVLFASPYTKSYEVIITVALLVSLAPQIITHIHAYETLLQFMNALNARTTVDQILECAREFYENMCVVEVRELRRQQRNALVHAGLVASGREPLPGWYVGPHAASPATPTVNTTSGATAAAAAAASAVDNNADYPTVEEMVTLFLKTDGNL